MIFTKRQAGAIARGRHTQTCIPAIEGKACPVKITYDYPVQYRDGARLHSTGRIKILRRAKQLAGDVTYAQAKAEGRRTTNDWKVNWVRWRDRAWVQREKIDLVCVYDDDVSIVDWILLERFTQRHADQPVWRLEFEPLVDAPRYLARPTRTSGDYVLSTARAIDPVECVDQATQERLAALVREDGEHRRAAQRRELEDGRQLRRNLRVG